MASGNLGQELFFGYGLIFYEAKVELIIFPVIQ